MCNLLIHAMNYIVDSDYFNIYGGNSNGSDISTPECLRSLKVSDGQTRTVTIDGGCKGKYLTLKGTSSHSKLSMCRIRVYGACTGINLVYNIFGVNVIIANF